MKSETLHRSDNFTNSWQWFQRKSRKCLGKRRWPTWSRFLLWSRRTEFNETWQEARSQCPLPSFSFLADLKKKQDGRPGLWLAEVFSTSLLKPLNGIKLQNLRGSKILTSYTSFFFLVCLFSGSIGKKIAAWPLIGRGIFYLSSETAERNSIKRYRKQDLYVLCKVLFFGPIENTKWPPWPLLQLLNGI